MDYANFENENKFGREVPSPRSMQMSNVKLSDFKFDAPEDKEFFSEFYYTLMFQTFVEEYTKSPQ